MLANAFSITDAIRTLGPLLYVVKDGRIIAKNISRMSSEILHNNKWEKLEFIKAD